MIADQNNPLGLFCGRYSDGPVRYDHFMRDLPMYLPVSSLVKSLLPQQTSFQREQALTRE